MKIECPVSLGELVDKLAILRIKEEMIADDQKLKHIKTEAQELQKKLDQLKLSGIDHYLGQLIGVNRKLWKIEDDIREKERQKNFDQEFIVLARAVYHTNDQRFAVKNEINQKFDSTIQEVKSYRSY
jgi:hypothetical protein